MKLLALNMGLERKAPKDGSGTDWLGNVNGKARVRKNRGTARSGGGTKISSRKVAGGYVGTVKNMIVRGTVQSFHTDDVYATPGAARYAAERDVAALRSNPRR